MGPCSGDFGQIIGAAFGALVAILARPADLASQPNVMTADAGYWSEDNAKICAEPQQQARLLARG